MVQRFDDPSGVSAQVATLAAQLVTPGAVGGPPMCMALADQVIANTTAETSCLANTVFGTKTIKANRIVAGTTLIIEGELLYKVPLLIAGTAATVRTKVGGATLITKTIDGSILGGVAGTLYPGAFRQVLTCRSVTGNVATLAPGGDLGFATSTLRQVLDLLNNGSDVTIDPTVDNDVDITFQWATASTTRSVTVRSAVVRTLY